MKRRTFILQGTILTGGFHFAKFLSFPGTSDSHKSLYASFKDPEAIYRPFIRWWWNGDKVEKDELARELRLLKEAGIGGVEINPVKFPARTNDLGKPSVVWLSDEWIKLLEFTIAEARSLGLACDLIVGSGWPFGAEWLEREEQSQIVVIGKKILTGPLEFEVSLSELLKEADPPIYSPFGDRKMEMLSVRLLPSILNDIEEVKDLSDQIPTGNIKYKIPGGKFILYALVKIDGFMQVIQGAPGANGPVLNHYNEAAVRKYLSHISSVIKDKLGPPSAYLHSFFVDSLELEGANWCQDMQVEFQKRRGYNLVPWLPFVLYKITAMGNSWVFDYGVKSQPDFKEKIQRIRYDFELTKAELLKERFFNSVIEWCKENHVPSRVQAYGRGYFPLEGSFDVDIPECETWIRPGLGTEMNESDYRIGRAYTIVNKYVSSAAHLTGKNHISCEELTNIHMVFNESLDLMKIAGDQSVISGVTHSVFHGFNYSPPDALFPGWVMYGSFINEKNPWWNYFHYFTQYKTRLSAVLQRSTMFADLAILPATADLWSIYGAQNDPFPAVMHPGWQTLIWESIHQNGNACDYISEGVIQNAKMKDGYLHYGPRKYHTIFLTQVERMQPATAKKLFDFIASGGRIFCIGSYPEKSCGWIDHERNDKDVQEWVKKMKDYPKQFILVKEPGNNFTDWFRVIQERYSIIPYVRISSSNSFITQTRYQAKDMEILVFINSNIANGFEITIVPSKEITSGKQGWLWDPETGERYRIATNESSITLDLAPADLKLLVFDKERKGLSYKSANTGGKEGTELKNSWTITGQHINGTVITEKVDRLKDLKEFSKWEHFCGNIVYETNFDLNDKGKIEWMNLGKVFGVAELFVNGQNAGTRWYGRRIYQVAKFLKDENNIIEVKLTTTMGNYLKSLTDNPIAQFWTNEGRTIQPLQSMGLLGPVTLH